MTDSRTSDRYLYVNTAAVPEWTAFGSVCYALGVAGKLVDRRSAAVPGASVASEAPQLTTRRDSRESCKSGEAERLIVSVQSVGECADVVNAVRSAYLALTRLKHVLPLWGQLTQVTSSSPAAISACG